ncbi:MAG: hypothetical protein KAZ88_10005 [Acidimicrobiia bacterium]|nr:hypothetical protein [Acidimicrobiia bacterium]
MSLVRVPRALKRSIVSLAAIVALMGLASPAGAIPVSCQVGGLLDLSADIPFTFNGPSTMEVGVPATYSVNIDLATILAGFPGEIQGSMTNVKGSLTLRGGGVEVTSFDISGPGNPSVSLSGNTMTLNIPGPVNYPGSLVYSGSATVVASTAGAKSIGVSEVTGTAKGTMGSISVDGLTVSCTTSASSIVDINVVAGAGGAETTASSAATTASSTADTTAAGSSSTAAASGSSTTAAAATGSSTTGSSTTGSSTTGSSTTGSSTTGSSTTGSSTTGSSTTGSSTTGATMAKTGASSAEQAALGLGVLMLGAGVVWMLRRDSVSDVEA